MLRRKEGAMMRAVRNSTLLVALSLLTSAATAYAEGWYLLAPPWRTSIKEGEDEFETMAPLTRWEQKGAYDSARTCEYVRLGIIKSFETGDKERLDSAAQSWIRHPSPVDPLQTKEGQEYLRWRLTATQARASRCVSISDPRLR
jgi:hypothetical protein